MKGVNSVDAQSEGREVRAGSESGETVALLALRRVSAMIGADRNVVQGAGGNTSFKIRDVMWIKASGTWLAEAEQRDIMVPVSLPALRHAIAHGDASAEHAEAFTLDDFHTTGLRPSIETSMHAALPHPVVFHVHSVDAIALSVREDGIALLQKKLAGLRWAYVPYRRPGLPLTRAIGEVAPDGAVDVLVLGNHGLVVAADDVSAAQALLENVVGRLAIAPRTEVTSAAESVTPHLGSKGYRLPTDSVVHAIAIDPISLGIAERGPLYPDHVVFLGDAPLAIDRENDLAVELRSRKTSGCARPKWVIVRGTGVVLADDVARGADEMARCLVDVAARIPADATLSFLGEEDIAALTDWDAEKYRQQLATEEARRIDRFGTKAFGEARKK
jgi:rhamnose utilization protein RhaD (predicted bifunctional aldolase and dehydrogenase)